MTILTRIYSSDHSDIWNDFIGNSKNGTFLFDRRFMEYHSDRFEDHSLLFFDDWERLRAVLPANRKENILQSHGGLTYGGLICDGSMTTPLMVEIVDTLIADLRARGFSKLVYKPIPTIYHRVPASEAEYALFQRGARLVRRDVSSAIDYHEPGKVQQRRARGAKKAEKHGVVVEATTDFGSFWVILKEELRSRYKVRPVHTQEEIELLHSHFPDNIQLFLAKYENRPVAGVLMFVSSTVAHSQYISASDEGKQFGALDLLFLTLVDHYKHLRYFSFGISTEDQGKYLNVGLITQKEGFGSSASLHDFYELDLHGAAVG